MTNQDKMAQFDFWVGEWDLTWGENGRGHNSITKILNEQIIQEQFTNLPDDDSPPFQGMSVSAYNPQSDQWQQTWVDNQGGYLDFTGGMVGDEMILTRQATIDGEPGQQRMVWRNIRPNALDWLWERSTDGGATWETLWHIRYRRQN